jgi:RNase H-fold protein (predicted Holliday junction resolvase)
MIVEEQLRKMREPKQANPRNEVKNKIISLVMMAIAALCAVFGYKQHIEYKAQRGEVIKLHREIKRLSEESAAARMEAAKLRIMLENERKNTETALNEMQKKPVK